MNTTFYLPESQKNLRTSMVLEKLFSNIGVIPIDELEKFVDKHSIHN